MSVYLISLITLGIILFLVLFSRFPLPTSEHKHCDKTISVIIPARNEEHNLPNLLEDLKKQSLQPMEIICCDDHSTDNTPTIIEDYGAVKITVPPLPKGWKGKTWACQNGALSAKGEILLFLDADVRLSSDALDTLNSAYQEKNSPISVQPMHVVKKPYEQLCLIFNLIQICSTGISLPWNNHTYGFYGPVLWIEKETFLYFNGYEPVKNDVIEDYRLGRFYRDHGVYPKLLLGGDHIRFRMYPLGFKEMIEGWAKNFSSGAASEKWWLLVMTFIWVTYLTALPVVLVQSFFGADQIWTIFLVLAYLITIFLLSRAGRKVATFSFLTYLFYPIPLLFFHIVFIYSIIKTYLTKTTTWKGRRL